MVLLSHKNLTFMITTRLKNQKLENFNFIALKENIHT